MLDPSAGSAAPNGALNATTLEEKPAVAPSEAGAAAEEGEQDAGEAEAPAPPTTRSKTAPQRKRPTPAPSISAQAESNRGVMTLSDVNAAREALAEKANAHWIKGLGGGQNKESETIVNFLYKMKVGPGESVQIALPSS